MNMRIKRSSIRASIKITVGDDNRNNETTIHNKRFLCFLT